MIVGLTVGCVALSLGGAFGLLSGRGVLIGMLSAAVYPLITSAFGGTRIQCSGPTGPMTTVFIALTMAAMQSASVPEELMPHFLNMCLFFSAIFLMIAGICRIGSLVNIVPNTVISGFMNGIALIIWISQMKKLLQIGSTIIDGPMAMNLTVATATLLIAFGITRLAKPLPSRLSAMLSGTLFSLLFMTVVCQVLQLPVDRATADLSLHSWDEFSEFLSAQSPTHWPWRLSMLALPWALQLAGVAYLDTLLTSLIIDRRTKEESQRNRELGVQGIATFLVALIGGIPGAQATERSVLMLKEGATTRLSGILVGLIGLIGVFALQDIVSMIPKAVFAGILLKVGYDVFDWLPVTLYFKQMRSGKNTAVIHHQEMSVILLTTLITALINVMFAVVIGTVVFFVFKALTATPMHDLKIIDETEGMTDEP